MIETALIIFRESLEAFLIIAITFAYLAKTGRKYLSPAIYGGVATALGLSVYLGIIIEDIADNPMIEGSLAMIAGLLVASMTVHVMRTSNKISGDIKQKIDRVAAKPPRAAYIGIFLFTVLMVAREGMETALMLGTIAEEENASSLMIGGALGFIATALIGTIWVKNAQLINLKLFLQTTGIFLVLFSIHLFIYGIHELSEANALPFVDNFKVHMATEIFDGGSPYAQALLYSMVLVPVLWLLGTIINHKFFRPRTVNA
ncbi:MAG: FTR1 family protein [Pseudobdellovibrionaceae bacterium]|jgi:high-affinity iron transporter|nr:FTR1 family protein [Pseudobdellovibrionaceae bacterium]